MDIINLSLRIIEYTQITLSSYHTDKDYILNPTSVIIILAILSYKRIGTKIYIDKNKLLFNDVSLYQGLIRKLNGYNRADIQYINDPIIWFYYYNQNHNDNIVWICNRAIIGLQNLKETYFDNKLIINCLSLYEQYISMFIEGTKTLVPKMDKIKIQIYNKLNEIWSDKHIIIIYNLLYELNEIHKQCDIGYETSLINTILQFIKPINNITMNVIDEIV